MAIYKPIHPGEFIKQVYLEPLGVSYRTIASRLNVAPSTFMRIVNGKSNVSPEMSLRLSKTLGRSPESWLIMQNDYNLYQARKNLDLKKVKKLAVAEKKINYE